MFQNLIAQGLVKEKKYPNGLSVFKYSREVFYKALWNTDPLLLEARGMVLDAEGNKVIWPFTKVFNYNENGTTLDPLTMVVCPRKVNGFMASVTRYRDEILVSTTGTLDSDYVGYAKEMLAPLDLDYVTAGYTFLFEIVHPKDPHIIEEEFGAYLIGCRRHATGGMAHELGLDNVASQMGAKRPEVIFGYFKDILDYLKECKHEGYMVRLEGSEETVMKLKSPHYLTKKFLMRMGKNKVEYMFNEKEEFLKNTDEEFYGVVNHITRFFTMEDWKARDDVARRAIIEEFFENTQR